MYLRKDNEHFTASTSSPIHLPWADFNCILSLEEGTSVSSVSPSGSLSNLSRFGGIREFAFGARERVILENMLSLWQLTPVTAKIAHTVLSYSSNANAKYPKFKVQFHR